MLTMWKMRALLKTIAAVLSAGVLFCGAAGCKISADDDSSNASSGSGGNSSNVLIESISIIGSSSVAKNGTTQLSYTFTPSNASTATVAWSSDNENVATVVSGKITGVATGSATITVAATDGSGIKATKTMTVVDASSVTGSVVISESGGWMESCYAEWQAASDSSIDGYNVYVKDAAAADSAYTKIDDMLVRQYSGASGSYTGTYYRADAMGLAAGTYVLKIVATVSSVETGTASSTSALAVSAHDRTGFAFTGSTIPGAYKSDGTLKDNAVVIYVCDANKDTVSLSVTTGSSTTAETGIENILLGYAKGKDAKPLVVRLIGNVTDPSVMDGGDLVIENNNSTTGITFEGVGEDAVANGWGIRLKNANYCEVRNIGFMNCNSTEGDDCGLQQNDNYVWVHNCDMFYGDAGSDADQAKGDGALDCKKSNYCTFSYNHFWDNGKCNLLGLSEGIKSYETGAYYITYHHNWYDHSDSRHPRCRYWNAHVYNNYYDGNAKYGAGSTLGSSVFMENNYFRNCKYPMMTSMQGTDRTQMEAAGETKGTFSGEDGGVIKAYGNYMTGQTAFVQYSDNNNTQYDAYVASSKTEVIPNAIVSYQGSNYYSNFDTNGTSVSMYSWTADDPATAMTKVKAYAGRMRSGDITTASFYFDLNKYTPTVDSTHTATNPDEDYNVIAALKSALTSYTGTMVKVMGDTSSSSSGSGSSESGGSSSGGSSESGSSSSSITSSTSVVFDSFTSGTAINGVTITGSLKSGVASKTYNSVTYTTALKMESSTSIAFTLGSAATVTLITDTASAFFKVDDTKTSNSTDTDCVMTISLASGSHTITKSTALNLYAIIITISQ